MQETQQKPDSTRKTLEWLYTNADALLNKRHELLARIENDNLDITCVTEVCLLPKYFVTKCNQVK